jgi:hypothetical protein
MAKTERQDGELTGSTASIHPADLALPPTRPIEMSWLLREAGQQRGTSARTKASEE